MTIPHQCDRGERFAIYDVHRIFCCYACPKCEREKRARYRAEIFTDPNYETTEEAEPS